MAGYAERRDAGGREIIELRDGQIIHVWLTYPSLVVFEAVGLVTGEFPMKWLLPLGVATMAIGVAHYFLTRKILTVLIDAKAKKLSLTADGRTQVVPLGEVLNVSITTEERRGWGNVWDESRLDLALRSGARVAVPEGFAQFREAHCQKLRARIDAALRRSA
jgi:hypothetical protein